MDRYCDPIKRLRRVFARVFVLAAILSASALAQAPALNVKTGLWDMSFVADMTAAAQTADLSKMTPAQRAQWDAMMKTRGMVPMSFKNCLTREKLAEHRFTADRAGQTCRQTVTRSTATTLDINQVCTGTQPSTNEIHVEAVSPTDIKVLVKQVAGRGSPLTVTMTGKWLAADCGDVK